MTDNEIKKGLEELRKNQEDGYITALEFGGKRDMEHEKCLDILGGVLDLINRQKAEIEQLNRELNHICYCHDKMKHTELPQMIEFAKAEAIKEFAERLPELIPNFSGETTMDCVETAVQHLKKEMVGEGNE